MNARPIELMATKNTCFQDFVTKNTSARSTGMTIHQGVVTMVYSVPSSAQLKGWVMGSRTTLRLSLIARKPCSSPLVSSRDCGKAAQDSFNASMDGKGRSQSDCSTSPPFALASRAAIDMGASLWLLEHHSSRPNDEKIKS